MDGLFLPPRKTETKRVYVHSINKNLSQQSDMERIFLLK